MVKLGEVHYSPIVVSSWNITVKFSGLPGTCTSSKVLAVLTLLQPPPPADACSRFDLYSEIYPFIFILNFILIYIIQKIYQLIDVLSKFLGPLYLAAGL